MAATGLTTKQAAERVLREAGGPLHADEITRRALNGGLINTKGKTPQATMGAQLAVAAKKGQIFVRTAPGVYGLRSKTRKGQRPKSEQVKPSATD
jgi:restriction system protein